jgi:DNA-binding HxlR family transcriptional regulator
MMTLPRRSNCPLNLALELFGDRWSLLLMRDMLIMGHYRYSEFLHAPEAISTNILASRLKQLEGFGLVEKLPDPNDRKTALYLPTELGASLLPVLLQVICWGRDNLADTGLPDRVARGLGNSADQFVADCLARLHNDRLELTGA